MTTRARRIMPGVLRAARYQDETWDHGIVRPCAEEELNHETHEKHETKTTKLSAPPARRRRTSRLWWSVSVFRVFRVFRGLALRNPDRPWRPHRAGQGRCPGRTRSRR